MPNWCFNNLEIHGTGNPKDIAAVKAQLNTPFEIEHDHFNMETMQHERKMFKYPNPVFAFWNIIKPTDMEEYAKQPDHKVIGSNDWYSWNIRNWGTKWDVAVVDDEKYPETELLEESTEFLAYRFNTAWSPPIEAVGELSEQYPDLVFILSFEEETGWGGEYTFRKGEAFETESYESKCRDCDSLDTLEYCDNGCGQICSSCNYLGEADLDCVAECEEHKIYLNEDHVPNYRLDQINV